MPNSSALLLFMQLLAFINTGIASAFSPDSATSLLKPHRIAFFTSASLDSKINWRNRKYAGVLLHGSVDYNYEKMGHRFLKNAEVRAELGYEKLIDSAWIKKSDLIVLSFQLADTATTGISHSYSVSLETTLNNDWSDDSPGKREWLGGPFNPAELMISYGLRLKFCRKCEAEIALAGIKFTSEPELTDTTADYIQSGNFKVRAEYGMRISVRADHKFTKNISWSNRSSYFSSGISTKKMDFSLSNRFTISIYKGVELRIESRVEYDRMMSDAVQFRQSVMLGYNFGMRNQ